MGWTFLFSKKHVLLGHPSAQASETFLFHTVFELMCARLLQSRGSNLEAREVLMKVSAIMGKGVGQVRSLVVALQEGL